MSVLGSGNVLTLLLLVGSTGVIGMGWGAQQQHGAIQVLHPRRAGNSRERKNTDFLCEGGREAAVAALAWSTVLLGCGSCSIILLSWRNKAGAGGLGSSQKRFSGTNPDLDLSCCALLCPGEQQGRGKGSLERKQGQVT